MRKFLIAVLMVVPPLAFGQLDSYSVTITASRNVTQQPDQVIFEVSVTTSGMAGLDDVVAVLQGSGITAADFTGINSQLLMPANTAWAFRSFVAFSKMTAMLTSLSNAQRNIAKTKRGWSLTFYIAGTRVSPEVQAANPCSIPDLMSDARAQAQKLASAAGFQVGSVWSMSEGGEVFQPATAFRIAAISPVLSGIPSFSSPPSAEPCSIVVKFKLIGN